jgi:hypothetical protein
LAAESGGVEVEKSGVEVEERMWFEVLHVSV